MYFSSEFIQSLKQNIPLEVLIGQYVPLKKVGNKFVGSCPFHHDQSPSFTVFVKTQSFYCFGCGAGEKAITGSSDHIAFLMKYHNLTFSKAVEFLAQTTQTPLPQKQVTKNDNLLTNQNPPKTTNTLLPNLSKKPILQKIFNLAAGFYHQQLLSQSDLFSKPEAANALRYLTEHRARSLEMIKTFRIGFATGGDELYRFLKKQGFSDQQLLDSQLIAKRANRLRDFFFGNIILFPHFYNGNVIGFTIKDFGQYKSLIKLRLFSRNTFYNQDCLADHKEIILVEGESDLHSIVQFTEHKSVVALCGNYLTKRQLQLLCESGITQVYLALDRDASGKKATLKISKQLNSRGIFASPLQWNCHKDIDLWLRFMPPEQRKTAFEQLMQQATKTSKPKTTAACESDSHQSFTPHSTQKTPLKKKTPKSQDNLKTPQTPTTTELNNNWEALTELLKSVLILLATIFILLYRSKSYIKHRKNPTPKTNPYRYRPTFSVDQIPVFEPIEEIPHYTVLLKQYQKEHAKKLKPVKRRKGKRKPADNARCQFCKAPAPYLSLNDGISQVYCKVCKHYSNPHKKLKDIAIKCPHCAKTLVKLEKDTEKNGYLIYKCCNKKCPFFIKNKRKSKKAKKRKRNEKLHYIYRKPLIDIASLHPNSPAKPRIDLDNARSSAYVIGLTLTYRASGLSNRLIETLMKEIHQVAISHQTVKNYVDAATYRLAPMLFNYPYQLSGILAADETYLRIIGKWGYLTFCFDPREQIIAALNVSQKRNLVELAKAINHALTKFPLDKLTEQAAFNPLVVTDGNPVYRLITQFLKQADIHINHKVVIGLENEDEESTNFRNLKQIIERLNKNFKKYMNNSEYFGSTNGAISAAVIFAAHFNFIRKNPLLDGKIPVHIPTVDYRLNQPSQWIRLIEHSQNFC